MVIDLKKEYHVENGLIMNNDLHLDFSYTRKGGDLIKLLINELKYSDLRKLKIITDEEELTIIILEADDKSLNTYRIKER